MEKYYFVMEPRLHSPKKMLFSPPSSLHALFSPSQRHHLTFPLGPKGVALSLFLSQDLHVSPWPLHLLSSFSQCLSIALFFSLFSACAAKSPPSPSDRFLIFCPSPSHVPLSAYAGGTQHLLLNSSFLPSRLYSFLPPPSLFSPLAGTGSLPWRCLSDLLVWPRHSISSPPDAPQIGTSSRRCKMLPGYLCCSASSRSHPHPLLAHLFPPFYFLFNSSDNGVLLSVSMAGVVDAAGSFGVKGCLFSLPFFSMIWIDQELVERAFQLLEAAGATLAPWLSTAACNGVVGKSRKVEVGFGMRL